MAASMNWGCLFLGVLVLGALFFRVYGRAPVFEKTIIFGVVILWFWVDTWHLGTWTLSLRFQVPQTEGIFRSPLQMSFFRPMYQILGLLAVWNQQGLKTQIDTMELSSNYYTCSGFCDLIRSDLGTWSLTWRVPSQGTQGFYLRHCDHGFGPGPQIFRST